jgi:hypothetical protein
MTTSGTEIEAALGELRREIVRRAAPTLAGAGIRTDLDMCRLVPERARLVVHFDLPTTASHAVRRALAVRVLDAVRGARRTYGTVHVSVHGPAAAQAPTMP